MASLQAMAEELPDRDAVLARELTKIHEEVVRAPIGVLAQQIAERGELKGEVVLLLGPPRARARARVDDSEIRSRIAALVEGGVSKSRAVKQVSEEAGVPRSEVYRIAHAAE